MNAAAITARTITPTRGAQALQPNELDLRRIVRLLAGRARYLYVMPVVDMCGNGYRIQSPCCSRKVDAAGGVIDIAWLEYETQLDAWKLYRKDHTLGRWEFHLIEQRLSGVMDYLNWDPAQVFWQ